MLNKQGKFGGKNIIVVHRYRDFRVGTFYFVTVLFHFLYVPTWCVQHFEICPLIKKFFHRLRLLLARLTRHICDVCQRRSVRCPSLGHISKTKQDRPISFHGMLSGSDGVSCFSIQLLSVTALVQYRYIARSWRPAPQPAGSELGEGTSPPPPNIWAPRYQSRYYQAFFTAFSKTLPETYYTVLLCYSIDCMLWKLVRLAYFYVMKELYIFGCM